MSLHPRPLLALVTCGRCAGCTLQYSLGELDALARTFPARTIVLEHGFSLYSPYDVNTTPPYVDMIEEEKAQVFLLFGVQSPTPLAVHLREDEALGVDLSVQGNQVHFEGLSRSPHDGVLGWAGSRAPFRRAVRTLA
jgi:hypothetical protein